MSQWRPNIFKYLDYRSYLRDYYTAAKANVPNFSYRYFAGLAGFSSPNFLKLVIDGKRNLGVSSIDAVARALQLDGDQHRFLQDLVALASADSAEARGQITERLVSHRRFKSARQIDGDFFEYLSNWYYPAMRELAARPDFADDTTWISAQLRPKVSVSKVRVALEALIRLGLLVREPDGRLSRGEPALTTPHELLVTGANRFHRQMLDRAAQSINDVPQNERDLSALTVCIAINNIAEVKRRLQRFREELAAFCDDDANPQVVYQLNMQLFPLSNPPDEDPG